MTLWSPLQMASYTDAGFRQKAVIEFLSNEGIAPKEISERLRTVYGDDALSYATVKRWVVHFNSGNKEITDRPRSGRPQVQVLLVRWESDDDSVLGRPWCSPRRLFAYRRDNHCQSLQGYTQETC